MINKKVLVTCPPMLGMISEFIEPAKNKYSIDLCSIEVTQTLSEKELIEIIPNYDGWIIGDDPATEEVFKAGKSGRLKAAVKWGVGTDNVNFDAAKELQIPIVNTPGMFGNEVADLAHCYLICLAREVIKIHNAVKKGDWLKIRGESLNGSTAGILGYGDIGKNLTTRLLASNMNVNIYDPIIKDKVFKDERIKNKSWPQGISQCDYLILTCSLNKSTFHILNKKIFDILKDNVKIINVSRGPLINEIDLANALESKKVSSAALDVFETEPLDINSPLRKFENCIFGSHNASNTSQAVRKTSFKTLELISNFLN